MTVRKYPWTLSVLAGLALSTQAQQEPKQVLDGLTKEGMHEKMRELALRIADLRAQHAPARQIDALQLQYRVISDSLGGDDPANVLAPSASSWAPFQNGGPQFVV